MNAQKKRFPPDRSAPQEPPLAMVLDLWHSGCDTKKIASLFMVPEALIYNMLARVTK